MVRASSTAPLPPLLSLLTSSAAGLGEARLRDLNDEINKLFREKHHWDLRVKELGGPDHTKTGGRMYDDDGKELPYSRGYRYFGAAKDLPGVRELFADTAPPKPKRNRGQLFAAINPDYYGFRDEDDGEMVPLEAQAEEAARAAAIAEWKTTAAAAEADKAKLLSSVSASTKLARAGQKPQAVAAALPPSTPLAAHSSSASAAATAPAASAATDASLRAHVPVLDQDAVTKLVLERKKRMIMAKYASSAQIASEEQAKQMLNIQR